MDMRNRIPINATLDPDLVKELDEWIAGQPIRTSRAAVIEAAIRAYLDGQTKKARR